MPPANESLVRLNGIAPLASAENPRAYAQLPGQADKPFAEIGRQFKKEPSFCVLLPMYNEAANVELSISRLSSSLSNLSNRWGIVAVDDGSTDDTRHLLHSLQKQFPHLIVESLLKNRGYGGACRAGYLVALREKFDYVLVMDADGTQEPQYISSFIELMAQGIDFIKATRYRKGSNVIGVTWKRRFVSWVGNKLAGIVLGLPISDYTNGFRAIKTSLIPYLDSTEASFSMLVEEVSLAKKAGATFGEVSYVLTARQSKESNSKFVYSYNVYIRYLRNLFR